MLIAYHYCLGTLCIVLLHLIPKCLVWQLSPDGLFFHFSFSFIYFSILFLVVRLVVVSGTWNSIMEILLSNLWNLCSNVNLLLMFGHFFSFSPFLLARFIVPMKKHIYTIFIRCITFHIGSLCYTFVDTDVVNLF